MPKRHQNREVEIKLRVPDVHALRLRLKQLHAQEIIPRTYESNTLYDTPSRKLTRRGQLIRIRIEEPTSSGGKTRPMRAGNAILTYKGPSGSMRGLRSTTGKTHNRTRFKIRDEVEVNVGGGGQMGEILKALGFGPVFRYEKFRTTYALSDVPSLKVEFDETPIGLFLELEGSATAIDRAAILLGYSRSDYVAESYGALYIENCRRSRRRPSHMLFPTKKMR